MVRLLDEGLEILVEGKITFPLNNAKLIRDIKQGKHELKDILKMIEERESRIEDAYVRSTLQNSADIEAINKLQIKILESFYEREKASMSVLY